MRLRVWESLILSYSHTLILSYSHTLILSYFHTLILIILINSHTLILGCHADQSPGQHASGQLLLSYHNWIKTADISHIKVKLFGFHPMPQTIPEYSIKCIWPLIPPPPWMCVFCFTSDSMIQTGMFVTISLCGFIQSAVTTTLQGFTQFSLTP